MYKKRILFFRKSLHPFDNFGTTMRALAQTQNGLLLLELRNEKRQVQIFTLSEGKIEVDLNGTSLQKVSEESRATRYE
jgi:hypothetical protein